MSNLRRVLAVQGRQPGWFWRQMGISNKMAFWRIENGVAPVPADFYERAAALLGVSVKEIRPEQPAELETVSA